MTLETHPGFPWVENDFYRQVMAGSARVASDDARTGYWVRACCRRKVEDRAA